MKNKFKKMSLIISAPLALFPIIIASCENTSSKNGSGNDWSIPSNKPGNEKNLVLSEKVDNKTVNDYFNNVTLLSNKHKNIDSWINGFNKIFNNQDYQFSFNRTSKDEAVDVSKYAQISGEKVNNQVLNKYLKFSDFNFPQSVGIDLKAKKENNKISILFSLYNPIAKTNKLTEKTLSFDFTETKITYEDLIEPVKLNLELLNSSKDLKNNESTKASYVKLETEVNNAKKLLDSKSSDSVNISKSLENMQTALDALNNSIKTFKQSDVFAELKLLVSQIKNKYTLFDQNNSIKAIKAKNDELKTNVANAEIFINTKQFDESKNTKFLSDLNSKLTELDTLNNGVEGKLDEFIKNLGSKLNYKNDNLETVDLSKVLSSDFILKETDKVEDLSYTLTVAPNYAYGKILISGQAKYGKFSKDIIPFGSTEQFKKNNFLNDWYIKQNFSDLNNVKNGTWSKTTFDSEKKIADELLTNIKKYLTNNELKANLTSVWIMSQLLIKDKEESKALKNVKENFLNSKSSKLEFIQNASRWYDFRRLFRVYSYANFNPTGKKDSSLDSYRNDETKKIIKDWLNDLISNYYNSKTTEDSGKWALFEFYAPFKFIELHLLINDFLDKEFNDKFFKAINRFAPSVSKYGLVEGGTSKISNRYIDNFLYVQYTFLVRNYTNLFLGDLTKSLQDATDYSDYLKNNDFTLLFKNKSNVQQFQKDIDKIRLFNNMYTELAKDTNKSDLGIFKKVDLTKLLNWFKTEYLAKEISFEKLNAVKGEELMKNLGIIYRLLTINTKYSTMFLNELKNGILKGKNESDFKNLSKINFGFVMNDWKNIFLKK
ncbi:hypothetical protein [Mycoplasmopsis alligatoris]|uniref:Lipoprotein n=1 Tax=Mycoplasmopsis alligatoris A21JP2 TaxID=747682 RepID=D4XUV3_9BACT|nr:hypothetical protein [Mycoplasmopsis alligatoris]EFF41871.1 hypothetical protein MALL_0107 [Mycoplasmopsis alligatoris A21JP2]